MGIHFIFAKDKTKQTQKRTTVKIKRKVNRVCTCDIPFKEAFFSSYPHSTHASMSLESVLQIEMAEKCREARIVMGLSGSKAARQLAVEQRVKVVVLSNEIRYELFT